MSTGFHIFCGTNRDGVVKLEDFPSAFHHFVFTSPLLATVSGGYFFSGCRNDRTVPFQMNIFGFLVLRNWEDDLIEWFKEEINVDINNALMKES